VPAAVADAASCLAWSAASWGADLLLVGLVGGGLLSVAPPSQRAAAANLELSPKEATQQCIATGGCLVWAGVTVIQD
jgi:hypothetical protein